MYSLGSKLFLQRCLSLVHLVPWWLVLKNCYLVPRALARKRITFENYLDMLSDKSRAEIVNSWATEISREGKTWDVLGVFHIHFSIRTGGSEQLVRFVKSRHLQEHAWGRVSPWCFPDARSSLLDAPAALNLPSLSCPSQAHCQANGSSPAEGSLLRLLALLTVESGLLIHQCLRVAVKLLGPTFASEKKKPKVVLMIPLCSICVISVLSPRLPCCFF